MGTYINNIRDKKYLKCPGPGLDSGGMILYSGIQYSGIQYSGIQYSGIQYSGIQYSGIQYSGIQYSGIQYSGIQYFFSCLPNPIIISYKIPVHKRRLVNTAQNLTLDLF
jgi:hypothetical protein